jgi:hypothetical protein
VPINWVTVGYQAAHECLEIALNIRVGVLRQDQRRAGVVDEDLTNTDCNARLSDDRLNIVTE